MMAAAAIAGRGEEDFDDGDGDEGMVVEGGPGRMYGGNGGVSGIGGEEDGDGEEGDEAPGRMWLGKKAQEEMERALEGVVEKEYMIKKRYGDPMDRVRQKEAAAGRA